MVTKKRTLKQFRAFQKAFKKWLDKRRKEGICHVHVTVLSEYVTSVAIWTNTNQESFFISGYAKYAKYILRKYK